MSNGSNYVQAPYEAVEANAISTYAGIPSGATIVRGIYYKWGDGGFTSRGWMSNIEGSPTNIYPEFSVLQENVRDQAVAQYVATKGDLDDVFFYWSQHYTLEGWDNFYNAVGVDSGCMDVDHSQS